MTVSELIEQLSKLDPELRVLRPGYEGGVADVKISEPESFCLDVYTEWWMGSHEYAKFLRGDESEYKQVNGIVL
jgi:hypothetical protein